RLVFHDIAPDIAVADIIIIPAIPVAECAQAQKILLIIFEARGIAAIVGFTRTWIPVCISAAVVVASNWPFVINPKPAVARVCLVRQLVATSPDLAAGQRAALDIFLSQKFDKYILIGAGDRHQVPVNATTERPLLGRGFGIRPRNVRRVNELIEVSI